LRVWAILLVAAAVRIRGAKNDLWLDEILAVDLTHCVTSPLHIVMTGNVEANDPIHTEVNHPLYTLYLYEVGPRDNPLLYRIHRSWQAWARWRWRG